MKGTIRDLVRTSKLYIDKGWLADTAMSEAWDDIYDNLGEDFTDEEIAKIRNKFFQDEFERLDEYETRKIY
jgi:hypothetical protein